MKHNFDERIKAMNWQCGRSGKIPRGKRRTQNFVDENKSNEN